ncbi:MAG: NUDIX domain-containing protein [Mariniphaga sp.]|nr:NUDIX domain-containing protein [Mariniphaga sp.]
MKQMYKVFLNDRLIRIDTSENITNNKIAVVFKPSCTPFDIERWFMSFVESETKEVLLTHPDPDLFFPVFQQAFHKIYAAGGVVLAKDQILFIFRNGIWDLPKGKMDPGEKNWQTALREVAEETGITGHRIVQPLPATFHMYSMPAQHSNKTWILKETFWFEMVYDGEWKGIPQEEEGITRVKWFRKSELGEVQGNTYRSLEQIIQLYAPPLR